MFSHLYFFIYFVQITKSFEISHINQKLYVTLGAISEHSIKIRMENIIL